MELVARYIEFCDDNFEVYSLELAHLLFAAASEVDVVSKLLCEQISPEMPRNSINDYKAVLGPGIPELPDTVVSVPRYSLTFRPWTNWAGSANPLWWRGYNRVKHQRDVHFREATLKNALNALGALLLVTFHYYARKLAIPPALVLPPRDATHELQPESVLLRLPEEWYYNRPLV